MRNTHRSILAVVALATFNLSAATLYVSLDSPNPNPPYTDWATAAHVIQDAVDAARNGDTVLVGDGVYEVGQREVSVLDTNLSHPRWIEVGVSRIVVTNYIRLRSVNGPLVTTINGGERSELGDITNSVRCVFLGANALLGGFTLTNGYADEGGGIFIEGNSVVSNCVLTGNSARLGGGAFGGCFFNCEFNGNSAAEGGGALIAVLNNCTLRENFAGEFFGGGGASLCVLNNCLVTRNSAAIMGGGVYGGAVNNCTVTENNAGEMGGGVVANWMLETCVLYNSIVWNNTAPKGPDYFGLTAMNYCCTTPLYTDGIGNIDSEPQFVNGADGDFRLRDGSSCIDAGTNLLGLLSGWIGDAVWCQGYPFNDTTDILGNTRFIDGNLDGRIAWDIGAYEFNSFKPPRFIGAPQRTAEGWKLSITGEPNKWTRVQRRSNVKDWSDIWSGSMPADGLKQVTDTETNQVMFYRAVVP